MDFDFMNIFVSEEVQMAFDLGFILCLISSVLAAFVYGLVDIIVSKYKIKHNLM